MLSKKLIQHTDLSSLIELDEFIKSNVIGIKTFRYYSKRPYTIIKNHIYTCLYYIDNMIIISFFYQTTLFGSYFCVFIFVWFFQLHCVNINSSYSPFYNDKDYTNYI